MLVRLKCSCGHVGLISRPVGSAQPPPACQLDSCRDTPALPARCGLHQVRMLGADRAEAESQIFATVVGADSDRLRLFKADHQCGIPKPARAGHNRRGKPVTLSRMCEFPQNQFGKAQMIDKARPIFLSPTAIDVQEADRTPADDATRGSGEYSEVAELLGKRTG
jgi:hypothetical protein